MNIDADFISFHSFASLVSLILMVVVVVDVADTVAPIVIVVVVKTNAIHLYNFKPVLTLDVPFDKRKPNNYPSNDFKCIRNVRVLLSV